MSQDNMETISEKTKAVKWKWLSEEATKDSKDATNMAEVRQDGERETRAQMKVRQRALSALPEMETLTKLAKRPPVSLEFTDLCYTVRTHGAGLSDKKDILKGVSGTFRTGELTAIMGSSGAGKSTLMNILAGYVTAGVSGSIKVNGHPRQLKLFNKLSTYIMQDDLIQPHLTVRESVKVAADLKLGKELSEEQKNQVVEEVLHTLGLGVCIDTRTERLSGGQTKRLSVALEMVNNPPIIFLDEPTTGLDVVSIGQLMTLLKKLARQGRTIICTIHQPTASIFEQFDRVYVMARGLCVYQGSHDHMVPFLSSVGLDCPTTHNPADFIIEVIQGENHGVVKGLSSEIQNGKTCLGCTNADGVGVPLSQLCRKKSMARFFTSNIDDSGSDVEFPTTFLQQFLILLKRKLIQQSRNKTSLFIMFFHHLLSGFLLGAIFLGVGNDATRPFDNFKFVMSMVVFFMYTYVMTPILLFPTEVKMIRREYFNRWYGLKSYFLALTVSTLPAQVMFGLIFTVITYLLSDQPLDIYRFLWFYIVGFLLGMASEGLGLTVGSVFSVMNGSIVGPASIVPLLAVAVYGMGYGANIEPYMQIFMYMSYLRYGVIGFSTSLYGHAREPMHCDEESYCHYKEPTLLLKDLGMKGSTVELQLVALFIFFLFYRTTAFLALRYRLTVEFSNKLFNFAAKVLRHK